MSLPKRKPKEQKPENRWRSPKHRDWLRTEFFCAMCEKPAPMEAAHVSLGAISGTGLKADDWRCVPLCGTTIEGLGCHGKEHTGAATFWAEYQLRHGQSVEQLIESLCKGSPKAAEIARIKRERANG